jgi:two-component system NtrC family sensor kinase
LKVRVWRQGELACFEVEDDGRGIDCESHAQIFDPFFTTRLSQGGSGLGLSVAHGIVQDHGGQIQVESELEKGTRVRVESPLAHEPEDDE